MENDRPTLLSPSHEKRFSTAGMLLLCSPPQTHLVEIHGYRLSVGPAGLGLLAANADAGRHFPWDEELRLRGCGGRSVRQGLWNRRGAGAFHWRIDHWYLTF